MCIYLIFLSKKFIQIIFSHANNVKTYQARLLKLNIKPFKKHAVNETKPCLLL